MMRVADFALHQYTTSTITSLQSRIADRNIQVSSGKVGRMFESVAADTGRLLNLETQHARTAQFQKSIDLVNARLQVMESNVSQLKDIGSELRSLLVQVTSSGNETVSNVNVQAQTLLDQAVSLLNVQHNGRYLFAGSKTDTAPVDLTDPDYTAPTVPSTADTEYYQGDGTKLSVQADVSLNVSYGATADEAPFEQLIRALNLAASGLPTDTPRMQEALSVVNQALEGLPSITTRLGTAQKALDNATKAHDQAQLYAEEAIGSIENVDVTEAITMVAQDQTTLEASFAMLAQISRVSLVDFL